MRRGFFESFLAILVLGVALRFVLIALEVDGADTADGYVIEAPFGNLGSLDVGTDVVVGGLAIGEVAGVTLDPEFGLVTAKILIEKRFAIPVDSVVQMKSYELLSPAVLEIAIGESPETVNPGGVLENTRDAVSTEDAIGRTMHGAL